MPPYPFVLDDSDPTEVPLEERWFALPQLYFTCYLRPRDHGRSPTGCRTFGEDNIAVQLMFYSTFEVLDLPGSGSMETRSVVNSEVVLALSNAHPLWAPSQMCWGQCPGCPCFSQETLSRPSSTVSVTCSAGPYPKCAGVSALVSQWKLYADNPALFP